MSVERRVIVEELSPRRKDGIAFTAVRAGSDGYLISTVPYWNETGIFETGVTELKGYTPQGRDAVAQANWEEGTHIEIYEGNQEDALLHHKRITENIADKIEGI